MNRDQLENPVLGYVVVAVVVVACLLAATVLGENPEGGVSQSPPQKNSLDCIAEPPSTPKLDPNRLVSAASSESVIETREVSFRTPPAAETGLSSRSVSRRWILGVRTTSTGAGCVVTEVVACSPAEKAGIRVGDRLVTVAGRQVGWIGARETPVFAAIDAAPQRSCELLIQKSGSGELTRVGVKLETMAESLGH